jgi:putative ABC transport system permease protein
MDTLRQDLRYAFRRLMKSPGFAIVALLTLSLGIGANSAIFSVINGVLLQPLPYAEPERLVRIYHFSEGQRSSMSGPNFIDLRKSSQTLADAAAIAGSRAILTGQGDPVRLDSAEVSASLFDLLGVQPLLGRTFRADENEPGKSKVALLSWGLWQQRFGGDQRVLGQRIVLDGVAYEVVGVMPQGFSYPEGRMLWTPLEYTKGLLVDQRSAWYLSVVGRAKPGVLLERVAAEVQTIGSQLAKQYPDHNEGVGLAAVPLRESMVGKIRPALYVLFGAVGFVLLIACANVANLLLARAAAREGEMAVRAALGAERMRLVRQLLTESIVLSTIGSGLGLLLAIWGVAFLISLRPEGIPRLNDVRVNGTVVVFSLALSMLTGVIFGIFPALQATRSSVANSLKEGGRGALTTRAGSRMRSALVVAEMALAVTLLTGAGLLIRSFIKLASVDPGFHVAQVLTFELSLPDSRFEKEAQQVAFMDQLLPRLHAIPGVASAGAVLALPLTDRSFVISFQIGGRPPMPPAQQPSIQTRVATTEYFQTMGIPLRRGRLFSADDRAGTPPVVLLTESAVREYFPNEEPLGKKITLGWGHGPGTPRAGGEVVGIVGDIKEEGLQEPNPPQIYLPYQQWPVQSMAVVLRTAVPPASISEAARRAVHDVDPNLPVSQVRTLEQIVSRSISQPRFYMTLLAAFAALALVLAAIGIFGVLSYAVAQRTREIGIRMALGAQESTVVRLVVREAMLLAAAGVTLGLIAAFFVSHSLEAFLFQTRPTDPLTFAGVATLLAVVALTASYIPARRATQVDPLTALRAE